MQNAYNPKPSDKGKTVSLRFVPNWNAELSAGRQLR
jgi:hypothetical protein